MPSASRNALQFIMPDVNAGPPELSASLLRSFTKTGTAFLLVGTVGLFAENERADIKLLVPEIPTIVIPAENVIHGLELDEY